MSVPIAVVGLIPKSRTRSGVIREPPPMPVMPTRKPTPRPKKMIAGSMCQSGEAAFGRSRFSTLFPFMTERVLKESADVSECQLFPLTSEVCRKSLQTGGSPGDPGALVAGQLDHVRRNLSIAQIGDRDVLQDPPQGGPHGDPDLAELLGVARILGLLGRLILDVREGSLDGADHAGERDLLRRLSEPVAAAGAAASTHEAGVLQLEQDVLEELKRDVLRLRELLALDGLVAGGSHFDGGTDGVVGFCADPHMLRRR